MGRTVIKQPAFVNRHTKIQKHLHYFDNMYISVMQCLQARTNMFSHLCDRLVIIKQR